MKNMVWHGQCETVIQSGEPNECKEYKVLRVLCKYDGEPIRFISGGASIDVHIDELREIVQRYDARI